jgi:transcriptional regulator with XRE-family HTH domain
MHGTQAKNLKFLRTRLFLTQEAFGQYFQLTRHQINSYETGRANVPMALISRLCEVFGLAAADFEQADFGARLADMPNVRREMLEQTITSLEGNNLVNEWREKYYTVLEKYNQALEELRHYKTSE